MSEPQLEDERIVAEDADFPPPGAARGPADLSRLVLHMVGHAHIDLGYRWNQAETVHYVSPWTFRGVLELMARTPGFTFCQSQLYLYEAMRREYPELWTAIRAAVGQGRWEVVGGSWCEYDAILPSGESVIRQHLHGVRYAAAHLDVTEHRVAFVPDSFCGHAATLPQILAGCGFAYYIFGRGLPRDPAAPERTRRAFRWVGPDGSELVAYLPFGPYSTPPLTAAYLEELLPYAAASVCDQELVLYGQGDHGGGPRDAEIQALAALASLPQAPRWRYGTVHGLCQAAFDGDTVRGLPEHRGNLGGFATGALTSQAPTKRRNRRLEARLLAAEATAMVGALLSRKPAFPRRELQQLWRRLLTEQFHDILPGTSVAAVYRDTAVAFDEVEEGTGWLLADGFARVRACLETRGDGACAVVLNPGLLPVSGPFRVPLPPWLTAASPGGAWAHLASRPAADLAGRLVDHDGVAVPCAVEGTDLLVAGRLPPLGYRTYRWLDGPAGDGLIAGAADDGSGGLPGGGPGSLPGGALPGGGSGSLPGGVLDTPRYRAVFDLATGDLLELEHRPSGRALLAAASNALQLVPEMGIATAWVEALAGAPQPLVLVEPPRVVAAHALFTRVTSVVRSACSRFRREVTFYPDQDRVDFRLVVDWGEGNAALKLAFAPALQQPGVRAALAHGAVVVSDPQREFCCHQFVDLHDGERGLALLNDGAYGCSVAGGQVRLSVLRTVRDMDPQMARGAHELRYALYPYAGAPADAVLLAEAGALEQQVLGAFEPPHPGVIKSWGRFGNRRPLPPAHSLAGVDCDHVVLCALKLPEEEWVPLSLVVRIRETDGRPADCRVTLPAPAVRAVVTDHLERPGPQELVIEDGRVRVPLRPFEIRTFLATL